MDEDNLILYLEPWVKHQQQYYLSTHFWVQYLPCPCYGKDPKGSLEVDGHHKYSIAWAHF